MKIPLVAAMALACGSALGMTLDFDDLSATRQHEADVPALYHTLAWSDTWSALNLSVGGFWEANGPAHSGKNALVDDFGGVATITAPTGGFVLDGLWLKGFFPEANQVVNLNVRGYNGAGLIFSDAVTVGPSAWVHLSGVSDQLTSLTIDGGFFLLDDLSLSGFTDTSTPLIVDLGDDPPAPPRPPDNPPPVGNAGAVPDAGNSAALLAIAVTAICLSRSALKARSVLSGH